MRTAIFVDDVAGTVAFYREVIGLAGGTVDASGMVGQIGDLVFYSHDWAGTTIPIGYLAAAAGAKTLGVMVELEVEDLESTYERVLTSGGWKAKAPSASADGRRVAFVRDCNGLLLALGEPSSR